MKKILVILIILILTGCKMKEEFEDCISGGGYDLEFNTNSSIKISSMHVCIACPPDSYEKLPIPEKDGYEFIGWYYDSKLTKKVEGESTLDVTPNSIKTKTGCAKGYKTRTLYAKWNKLDE